MGFIVKCQYKDGILITYAYVGICSPELSQRENVERLEAGRKLVCLFDAGAKSTFVDRGFLQAIGAEPTTATERFQTGNGILISEQYKVDICLPNHTLIPNMIINAADTGLGVIIGMDIISRGKFILQHKKSEGYIRFDMD